VRTPRIYIDTSVIGGCLDEEFAVESSTFFREAEARRIIVLLSDVVLAELESAPEAVRNVLANLDPRVVEQVPISREVEALRDGYLTHGVVSPAHFADATHVAAATVARADAIVSWNFRHIVRLDRIKAYNAVNLLHGYGILTILSPKEVAGHGEEDL
jgi:predicted nucleic acid-binding protein